MKIDFLGQGFEPVSDNAVGNHLIDLLNSKDYHTFTILTAFISTSGVRGILNILEDITPKHVSKTIITGIDQKGTSKEALEMLVDTDLEAYVYHQPSSSIFHPKIYLFEGDDLSSVIIGSTNLTGYGLFVNVEASFMLTVKKADTEYQIIKDIKKYFESLFDRTDPNLKSIDQELIDNLVSLGIVPTEVERNALYIKVEKENISDQASSITPIILFPKRDKSKIPSSFSKKKSAAMATPSLTAAPIISTPTVSMPLTSTSISPSSLPAGQLVWYRSSLPSSSVQGGTGSTNPTGGLRLVQANFRVGGLVIDQTTYFRNSIFGNYNWAQVTATPFVEVAVVPFEIIINGVNHGIHNLQVRHKPSGVAGQGNYTTSISWGTAGIHVSSNNLVGRSLSLYSPTTVGGAFQILIN